MAQWHNGTMGQCDAQRLPSPLWNVQRITWKTKEKINKNKNNLQAHALCSLWGNSDILFVVAASGIPHVKNRL